MKSPKSRPFLFIVLGFFLLTALGAQEVGQRVLPSSRAWIHGLPAFPVPGGKPVEVVDFRAPSAASRSLDLVIVSDAGIVQELKSHLSSRRSFATLKVVVRRDPKAQEDLELTMTGVTIAAVSPKGRALVKAGGGLAVRQVTLVAAGFHFDKITTRMLLSSN